MSSPDHSTKALASAQAFAGLATPLLETLYSFCSLKVLAKGESATVARAPVDELVFVLSGRLAAEDNRSTARDIGPGQPVEELAFFSRGQAGATWIALRETVLLVLGWDDLLAACGAAPELLEVCLATAWKKIPLSKPSYPAPSQLVLCPAGADQRLSREIRNAILAGLEELAEVRFLTGDSFGGGLPGAISFAEPQSMHWLQEQELNFDVTVRVADAEDSDLASEVIEEADEILLVASSSDASLGAFEKQALKLKGRGRCRLVFPKGHSANTQDAASWTELRPCRSFQLTGFESALDVRRLCSNILGKGLAIAASSRGAYAAAIMGAIQALEATGLYADSIGAAGSAVLPLGLLGCGYTAAGVESVFAGLANPALWRRTARAETALFEAAPVDRYLVEGIPRFEIAMSRIPLAAVSRSLSRGTAEVLRTGRLHGAVRANLVPDGILPPLIKDDGTILVSGENEIGTLLDVVQELTASPVFFLSANIPSLGISETAYRDLAHSGPFRLVPFQTQAPIDRRVRLESILGAAGEMPPADIPSRFHFAIPIPEGITPLDWHAWEALRDAAFVWTASELQRRGFA
jgi:NTE family protein